MGINSSSIASENIEYIHSPKFHCPIKPFPINTSNPIFIKQKINDQNDKESKSCPSYIEHKILTKIK